MLRQLETGRDISKMLGGKDRDDGVGQVVLGMWFARRLKGKCPGLWVDALSR